MIDVLLIYDIACLCSYSVKIMTLTNALESVEQMVQWHALMS